MDTGKGKFLGFETEEELKGLQKLYPQHGGCFTKGEIVTIKGSRFRVKSVQPTELRLVLLKRPEPKKKKS